MPPRIGRVTLRLFTFFAVFENSFLLNFFFSLKRFFMIFLHENQVVLTDWCQSAQLTSSRVTVRTVK